MNIRNMIVGAFALVVLASAPCRALDDELRESSSVFRIEPGDDAEGRRLLQRFEQLIRLVLSEAYAHKVRSRVIAVPTLSTEWVVALRIDETGQWELFNLTPRRSTKLYLLLDDLRRELDRKRAVSETPDSEIRKLEADIRSLEADLPKDPRNIPIDRCVVRVSEDFAQRIQGAWTGVLRGAIRRDAPESPVVRVIADGTTYHFWQFANPPLAAGVRNPESVWRSGRLAQLGGDLRAYCLRPDRAGEQRILAAAAALKGQ